MVWVYCAMHFGRFGHSYATYTKAIQKKVNRKKNDVAEFSALIIQIGLNALQFYREDGMDDNALNRLMSISADRVAVNRSAVMGDNIRTQFPKSMYIDCHPHTLHHCGEQLDIASESPR